VWGKSPYLEDFLTTILTLKYHTINQTDECLKFS
jgi:hypothetical protein